MSCIICCEDYTEKLRRPIKCLGCKKEVCLICFKRHLLDNRNLQCMFPDCEKAYSFTEISRMTGTIKFSNEIMDKLGLIALEEEKNFLPQRQKIAKQRLEEQKYELRRIERTKIKSEINKDRYQLDNKLRMEIRNNKELLELDKKIRELQTIKSNLNSKLYKEKDAQIKPYIDKIKALDQEDSEDRKRVGIIVKKENHYTFVKNCVFKGCKGFLENNPDEKGWKCTLCDRFTCRKCHEPLVSTIDENDKKVKHKCDENTVANIKEMKKDTKPCPKCGMGIFKIDGCFSPETKLMLFNGKTKLVKDIKVGDQFAGIDLTSRNVIEIFQGEDEMYLVEQSEGFSYKVNSKHTLVLKYDNCYLNKSYDYNYVNYFCDEKKEIVKKQFHKIEASLDFLEKIKHKFINITVEDYLKLPYYIRYFMKGINTKGPLMGQTLTNIKISPIGKGKYHGFMLDKDHTFLGLDGTVLRNCNTMFCIGCQTYFDWGSGKIYKRAVHNPDAVRWMREQGRAIRREEGDDGCTDPFVNNHVFYNWMYRTGIKHLNDRRDIFNTIMELSNYGTHIMEVVVPRFADNYNTKTQSLSIDYLITDGYTEEKWKKDIRKYKKQQMFNMEFRNIITLLTEVMRTVLGNIREMITRKLHPDEIVAQLELIPRVAEECNEKFEDIKQCFNSKRKTAFHISRDRKDVLFQLSYR